jgi:hypothetical protein
MCGNESKLTALRISLLRHLLEMSTSIANLAVGLNSERYTKRVDVMDKYGPYDMQYTKGCIFCEMLWHNQQPEKED